MKVGRYLMQEYWLDIGRVNDYEAAQAAYKEHFKPNE
jgi:NDP-sugar pyrophosphorylase family protein